MFNQKPIFFPLPLAVLLVPFMAGIFFAKGTCGLSLMDLAAIYALICCALVLFSLSLFGNLEGGLAQFPKMLKGGLLFAVVLTSLFLAGIFHFHLHKRILRKSQSVLLGLSEMDQKVALLGRVVGLPVPGSEGSRVKVFVKRARLGTNWITVNEEILASFRSIPWEEIRPGQVLLFSARVYKIKNFGTPGTFDFENFWALRGIMTRVSCSSPLEVVFLKGSATNSPGLWQRFYVATSSLRRGVIETIFSQIPSRDVAAVAVALVTGSRAWLSEDLRQLFSASGLGHLFAVSGLHMAIVAAFPFFLLKFLGKAMPWLLLRVDIFKISWPLAVVSCGFYCLLSGLSPSSLRAFVMISSLALCMMLERKTSIESGLVVAAWLLLFMSPFYLFDISFQLSFLMVFFLIHVGRAIEMKVPAIKRRPLVRFLMVCILAFVVSSPLAAFYFQRLNPWAMPLNVLCIPVVEFVALPALFAGTFCSLFFPWLANTFIALSYQAIDLMILLAKYFTGPFWSNHFVIPPTLWELAIIILILLVLPLSLFRKRWRPLALSLLMVLVSGHFLESYLRAHRSSLLLHVVDVGQGLCQVLELPGGAHMVVDSGGFRNSDFDVGSRVVAPYLRRLGIEKIDILAISHPDTDHIGGAASILKEFQVGRIWLNSDENLDNEHYREFIQEALKKGVPIRRFSAPYGQCLENGLCIECLLPKDPKVFSRNDRGLVIRLLFKERGVLLPGDIEAGRESSILATGVDVGADVIVVPHHGARHSSSLPFLRKVSPRVAVCSCGYKNPFHHPERQVVERYRTLGIAFLRTNKSGTVDIKIAGDGTITASGYYMKDKMVF